MNPPALSEPQLADYHRNGFVVVSGLFSREEARGWQEECVRIWEDADVGESRVQWRTHNGGRPIADRLDPVIDVSPVFDALAHDGRILEAVEAALGGRAQLFKDKLITKRPGTDGYGLHQDYPYYAFTGLEPDALVSVQVSIDAADEANGALEVFPGLHHERLAAPPDEPRDVDASAVDLGRGHVVRTEPGDLLLFHSLVPHQSDANTSGQSRRALYLTYARTDDEGVYDRYYASRPEY